jgi:hypothetical protein
VTILSKTYAEGESEKLPILDEGTTIVFTITFIFPIRTSFLSTKRPAVTRTQSHYTYRPCAFRSR